MTTIRTKDVMDVQKLVDDIEYAYNLFLARQIDCIHPELLKRIDDKINFLESRKDWKEIETKLITVLIGRTKMPDGPNF